MSPLSSSVPQSLSFSYAHVRPRCSQNSSGNLWDPIPNLDNITPTALSSEPTLHPSVYEAVLSQVDCQDSAGLEAVLRLWNIWHIFKLTCSLWGDAVTWFLLIFSEAWAQTDNAESWRCCLRLCHGVFVCLALSCRGLCPSGGWDFLEMKGTDRIKRRKTGLVLWLIGGKVKPSPSACVRECVPS